MSQLITLASPRPSLAEAGSEKVAPVLSFGQHCESHESLTIPNRGFVIATLLSSVLWGVLILSARELWLVLR